MAKPLERLNWDWMAERGPYIMLLLHPLAVGEAVALGIARGSPRCPREQCCPTEATHRPCHRSNPHTCRSQRARSGRRSSTTVQRWGCLVLKLKRSALP